MKVLVTGGAGYVGSTVISALRDAGDEPIALDDLSKGRAEFLDRVPSYVGDVADPQLLDKIFAEHPEIGIAIHCAARIVVSESMAEPLDYYRTNIGKAVELYESLLKHGCHRVIFSSSAAVYGTAPPPQVTETSPVQAASPYAATKLMMERILDDVCAATPMRALSLRYFNPIGADPRLRSGFYDPTPTHALGRLLAAAQAGEPFWIHGQDWATPDGTPMRDFVHIWDVARAHVAAARRFPEAAGRHEIVNIGSGRATTVRELADAFNAQAPAPVPIRYDERRTGDTIGCYAVTDKAGELLGWHPELDVAAGIRDALRWAQRLREPDRR